MLRDASQKQDELIYLKKAKYLKGKKAGAKAWHHQHNRIGVQESSPQNNFRRIIACYIPKGNFCNHLINYFPENELSIPPYLLLALLNSNLSDWYFRLGSTNAHINHYQLYNLPAPQFAEDKPDASILSQFSSLLDKRDYEGAFDRIESLTAKVPFSQTIGGCLTVLVEGIIKVEVSRGDIARSERSELAEAAQTFQRIIDRIIFRLAGLTDAEAEGLEQRLSKML